MLVGENMTLREYLKIRDLNIKDFSEQLDYSRCYLSMVINGSKKPGSKLLRMIERKTEGQVTAENAFSDVKK